MVIEDDPFFGGKEKKSVPINIAGKINQYRVILVSFTLGRTGEFCYCSLSRIKVQDTFAIFYAPVPILFMKTKVDVPSLRKLARSPDCIGFILT